MYIAYFRRSLNTCRFTEIGGPSFYVSFLGQDSLYGTLDVNVTFDPTLDWMAATPELAYWDIGELDLSW